MNPKISIAIKAARQAGRIILKASENLSSIKIHEKGKNNYVTDIDLEVEQQILSILRKFFPDQYYITEESGSFGNKSSKYTWIIDPIDGTNNFIHGLPHHCVSIAMQCSGKVEIAVVYNPYLDQLFIAEKGSGAQLNGQKIRVTAQKDLPGAMLSGVLKYDPEVFKDSYPHAVLGLYNEVSGLRYSGSLALDMCYVAAGYLDAIWTSREAKIWDIAAATLIIKESGGMICGLDGGVNFSENGRLIGGNPKIVSKLALYLSKYLK